MIDITQTIDNITIDQARAYAQTTDKYLYVVDTFFDVTSINDVPLSFVERIEDRLEQLMTTDKEYKVEQWYNEDGKKDGWALIEFKLGSFNEYCIDIYSTKAQALKVLKQLTTTKNS